MGAFLLPLAIALLVYRKFDRREPRRWFQFPWWAPLVGALALEVFLFVVTKLAGGEPDIDPAGTAEVVRVSLTTSNAAAKATADAAASTTATHTAQIAALNAWLVQ